MLDPIQFIRNSLALGPLFSSSILDTCESDLDCARARFAIHCLLEDGGIAYDKRGRLILVTPVGGEHV